MLDTKERLLRFTAMHPPGSRVWYWSVKNRGPVKETTVSGEPFEAHSGEPVVFLYGISGYVAIDNVTGIDEPLRDEYQPTVLA